MQSPNLGLFEVRTVEGERFTRNIPRNSWKVVQARQ
jgi:hypothetical protein